MAYLPKSGDIIKMRAWHGIVLDVFKNDRGRTVLQVQTVRNIFRKLGPELIEVDIAPDQITPATLQDLLNEIIFIKRCKMKCLINFWLKLKTYRFPLLKKSN